jgi:hypothetical protein
VRRASLVRRFGLALTRGSQTVAVGANSSSSSSSASSSSGSASSNSSGGGGARPIDLHAHDPFRYVSDMLAWVHQVRDATKINSQTSLYLYKRVVDSCYDCVDDFVDFRVA